MDIQSLTAEELSSLVDTLLRSRDPASVAVRRILKKKEQRSDGFPLQTMRLDEFHVAGQQSAMLSDDERRIIVLEKKAADLAAELESRSRAADEAVREAYRKGMAEGMSKGEQAGAERASAEYEKKLMEIQRRFSAMLQEYESVRRGMILATQHVLARLSCVLARKVIHAELTANPEAVLQVIKKALTYIADRESITIRVCPADLETVSGKQDFWKPVTEGLDKITIIPDERVSHGGCIIESGCGVADARLEVQLAELESLIDATWESLRHTAAECAPHALLGS